MAGKIAIVIFGIILILFFLSVIAPMKSESKFWHVIHKIRAGMDLTVYWFFNICAILTILCVIWMGVHAWITAGGLQIPF